MAAKAYVVSMTVSELKDELKQRGLSTKGSKNDLRDRLEQALYDEELDDPESEAESDTVPGYTMAAGGFNFEVPPESFIAEEDMLAEYDEVEEMVVSVQLANRERLEVHPHINRLGVGDRTIGDGCLSPMIVAIELGNNSIPHESGEGFGGVSARQLGRALDPVILTESHDLISQHMHEQAPGVNGANESFNKNVVCQSGDQSIAYQDQKQASDAPDYGNPPSSNIKVKGQEDIKLKDQEEMMEQSAETSTSLDTCESTLNRADLKEHLTDQQTEVKLSQEIIASPAEQPTEMVPEGVANPAEQPTEMVPESVASPAEQPTEMVLESVANPAEQPTEMVPESVAGSAEQPTEMVPENISCPVEQSTETVPAEQPTEMVPENVASPAEQSTEIVPESVASPAEQLTEMVPENISCPVEQSTETVPAEQPTEMVPENVASPAEQSTEIVPESVASPAEQLTEMVPENVASPAEQSTEIVPESVASPAEQPTEMVPENVASPAKQSTEMVPKNIASPAEQLVPESVASPAEQSTEMVRENESGTEHIEGLGEESFPERLSTKELISSAIGRDILKPSTGSEDVVMSDQVTTGVPSSSVEAANKKQNVEHTQIINQGYEPMETFVPSSSQDFVSTHSKLSSQHDNCQVETRNDGNSSEESLTVYMEAPNNETEDSITRDQTVAEPSHVDTANEETAVTHGGAAKVNTKPEEATNDEAETVNEDTTELVKAGIEAEKMETDDIVQENGTTAEELSNENDPVTLMEQSSIVEAANEDTVVTQEMNEKPVKETKNEERPDSHHGNQANVTKDKNRSPEPAAPMDDEFSVHVEDDDLGQFPTDNSMEKSSHDHTRESHDHSRKSHDPTRDLQGKRRRESSRSDSDGSSIKKRRISANLTAGTTSTDRKRRWGSGRQRSNSGPSPAINSDLMQDIIPAEVSQLVELGQLDCEAGEASEAREGGEARESGEGSEAVKMEETQLVDTIKQKEEELRSVREMETRQRIEARLRAKREAEEAAKKELMRRRTPSPARHAPSRILHVEGLTRPFTRDELQELLSGDGPPMDEAFWIDKIRSHCVAVYDTKDIAMATRERVHGIKWPVTNPKHLSVDFLSSGDVAIITDGQLVIHEEGDSEPEDTEPHAEESKPVTVEPPVTNDEPPPIKPTLLLDELFRKTKATPSIYWLPLTEAQITERVQQAKAAEEERERARTERRKAWMEERRREDQQRTKRLDNEKEKRARQRLLGQRSRSRSRERRRR